MKKGQRVSLPNYPQLSDGVITDLHYSKRSGKLWKVTIMLDKSAPVDVGFETDEVTMFVGDVELV